MRPVWYLCKSIAGKDGLLFPEELPDDDYSQGAFMVEAFSIGPEAQYVFRALREGVPTDYVLRQIGFLGDGAGLSATAPRVFVVVVEGVGSFGFLAKPADGRRIAPLSYVGERLRFGNVRFWTMFPHDPSALERACVEADFFFVGVTSRDVERSEPDLVLTAARKKGEAVR